jgi:CRP-like cAMP-binding protein
MQAQPPPTDTLRAHIEKVVPLTEAEAEQVLAHFTFKKCRKHQLLVQEGEAVPYMHFIAAGLVKLVYTDDSGKQHIVSFAMEDWWETDARAFFTQTRATMSLECIEDTEVFRLAFTSYQQLCAQVPKMEHFFLQKATFGFIGLQQRLVSLLTTSAKQRYEQLLARFPALRQRVPKTQLAAYLGVSRETLSRLDD